MANLFSPESQTLEVEPDKSQILLDSHSLDGEAHPLSIRVFPHPRAQPSYERLNVQAHLDWRTAQARMSAVFDVPAGVVVNLEASSITLSVLSTPLVLTPSPVPVAVSAIISGPSGESHPVYYSEKSLYGDVIIVPRFATHVFVIFNQFLGTPPCIVGDVTFYSSLLASAGTELYIQSCGAWTPIVHGCRSIKTSGVATKPSITAIFRLSIGA